MHRIDEPDATKSLSACIAMIGDLPYGLVPSLAVREVAAYCRSAFGHCYQLAPFHAGYGVDLNRQNYFALDYLGFETKDLLVIVGGESPRPSKELHYVVALTGENCILHDPHPSRAGIIGLPQRVFAFNSIPVKRPLQLRSEYLDILERSGYDVAAWKNDPVA